MSRQEQQQQGHNNAQNRHLPLQRPTASRNLYLDFSRPYEKNYERVRGERRPVQSAFVSSTSWTANDATWYKAQTTYAPSNIGNGAAQDCRITCSQNDIDNHLLRELLND